MVSAEAPSLASVGVGGLGKEGRKKRGAVGGWLPPVVDMRGVLPSEPKCVSVSERSKLAIWKGKADVLQVLLLQPSFVWRGAFIILTILFRDLKGMTDGSLRERRFALSEFCLSASSFSGCGNRLRKGVVPFPMRWFDRYAKGSADSINSAFC